MLRPEEVLLAVVERIAAMHPAPAQFSADETAEWPTSVTSALIDARILEVGPRADNMFCRGCDLQCHKPVVVRRTTSGGLPRAFIVCDEAPDYGRVAVSMDQRIVHRATLRAIAALVARSLQIGPERASPTGAAFFLGQMNGRHGSRTVQVQHDRDDLMLCVGQQRETLAAALIWTPVGLAIDIALCRRLVDRKQAQTSAGRSPASDRTWQRTKARETRVRDAAIFREAKRRRAESKAPWKDIAQQIETLKLADGISAARIRRIIAGGRKIEREKSRSIRKTRK